MRNSGQEPWEASEVVYPKHYKFSNNNCSFTLLIKHIHITVRPEELRQVELLLSVFGKFNSVTETVDDASGHHENISYDDR